MKTLLFNDADLSKDSVDVCSFNSFSPTDLILKTLTLLLQSSEVKEVDDIPS